MASDRSLNTLAEKVDKYYTLREARLARQKEADALQEAETELKEDLIRQISKSDASGVAGKIARVSVVTKREPAIKDFEVFMAYVSRRKAWDLLQRRVSAAAIKARWEDGKEIPGIEAFPVVGLSLSKLK